MTGFTLWRADLPAGLHRDQLVLGPGARHDCAAPHWRDSLLVVEDGRVVLACAGGELDLPQGSVFCLTGLTRPVLHNPGPHRAALTTLRRTPEEIAMTADQAPAAEYREIAGRFTRLVEGVPAGGWDRPAPVAGWTARDVVRHLVEWFPGFLAGGADVTLPAGPAVDDDPVGAWRTFSDGVQAVLDDPATDARRFTNPHTGDLPLPTAVSRFFTADVFLHSWDLARATGQDETLDPQRCATMLAGMEPIEELMRSSGQYGPRVPVPADADPQTRLLGFIGRDPHWTPA